MVNTPHFPSYWSDAIRHLSKKDKIMKNIINSYQGEGLRAKGEAFITLARAIAGQQISVKAAESVWRKLEQAVPTMTPAVLLATSEDALRACGLSRQKIHYLHHLANAFAVERITPHRWDNTYTDAMIIKELVALKGIGQWTAEMFLIFHLLRPDVLPLADIGLQKAIQKHYGIEPVTKKELYQTIETIAEPWKPYRSVATWYLWRSLDPVAVEY